MMPPPSLTVKMFSWTAATLFYLSLTSCVVIPYRKQEARSGPAQRIGCEKIGISASFTDVIYSDFSFENPLDPKEKWRGSVNPSWVILTALESNNLFMVGPSKNISQKYFISFKIVIRDVANGLQRFHLWMSNITLGLFPGYGDGQYYLNAEIFNSDGKKIEEYRSSSIKYNYFHGLIFLPLNYHTHTRAYITEKYLPGMTDEIVDKMVRDKLIRCSWNSAP